MTQFDFYGNMAAATLPDTVKNGRYGVQIDAEKNIPQDVIVKLDIQPSDTFLDIGCGMGLNLLPISKMVSQAYGCDHSNVIAKLQSNPETQNINFFSGDFTSQKIDTKFSKILVYSVLHALPNDDVLSHFLDKVLNSLSPSGSALLGDIPNKDKKQRFLNSQSGQIFQKEWEELCAQYPEQYDLSKFQTETSSHSVSFNDKKVLQTIQYIRSKGYHAYIVDQPADLPFGNTREDILIKSPG